MIHIVHHGQPLCGFSCEPPMRWPPEDAQVGLERQDVATCPRCKAIAFEMEDRFKETA